MLKIEVIHSGDEPMVRNRGLYVDRGGCYEQGSYAQVVRKGRNLKKNVRKLIKLKMM